MREDWLNGWPRIGTTAVLIGTSVRCLGCGKDYGITTVVFDDDAVFPAQTPAWPFDEETCPVCALQQRLSMGPEDKLTARLKALRL